VDAIVAGPAYLASLCQRAFPAETRWSLSDLDGRLVLGETPPDRRTAVRTAVTAGLPWTLHVFPPSATLTTPPPRTLLVAVIGLVALVLAAGWYFVFRSIGRERRVAELQSDFVAAVSHEFRSPLTPLGHAADLLAHGRLESEELRRQSYGVLVRETARLRGLVEGLLDFGRFEAGASAFRFDLVDLGALVRDTVSGFQDLVTANGFRVELSGADGAIHVRADREALTRALWNLLDNAVKYSPDCRTVWVSVEERPDRVSITVRDQGIGIPLEEQRVIFDRFVRGAESKSRRIRGTGIGLAMVRNIAEAHHGDVVVSSEPGQGSRFTLSLRTEGAS
jgi:signal transduction histidine kinase